MKDYEDRRWPVMIESLWGKPIQSLSAGESHSMVLTVSGNVYAFGSNKVMCVTINCN
jgi:alpha-tubulin suppressor-like RCC1 family protein